jgi:hypothetical protein
MVGMPLVLYGTRTGAPTLSTEASDSTPLTSSTGSLRLQRARAEHTPLYNSGHSRPTAAEVWSQAGRGEGHARGGHFRAALYEV